MAKKFKKVYMPKWVMWFVVVMMVPMFALIEYEAFFGKDPYPSMGIAVGFMLLMVIAMMFLMGYRKLPYFLIES
jgi:ribose/xylose/arabinose/galactoside ABC-type transport system permease subunit